MKKYIVDSNFILRYLLADNKEQYIQAKNIFDEVLCGKIQIKLEQSVFVEIIFILASFYEIPKDKIANILGSFLKYKGIDADVQLLRSALAIYRTSNIHIVDAIIAASSAKTNIPVLTFDKQLSDILEK